MDETLLAKGLKRVVDGKIYVTGLKGPLEDGWEEKVGVFVTTILTQISG